MGHIPTKTLEDLEYQEVLRQCADFAITPLGKKACLELTPEVETEWIMNQLQAVSEFRASFENENRIPNHGFESLTEVFALLKIENSVLEVHSFRNITTNTETTNTLISFLKKFQSYYPTLFQRCEGLTVEKESNLQSMRSLTVLEKSATMPRKVFLAFEKKSNS